MARTTASTKQACDACRRRKVKCDGQKPCGHCCSANLDCTSLVARRKGGRNGRSANVLQELREAQAQGRRSDNLISPNSTAAPVSGENIVFEAQQRQQQETGNQVLNDGSVFPVPIHGDRTQDRAQTAPGEASDGFVRTPGLLPGELVESCVDFFFSQLGGTVPILHRHTFEKQIDLAETSLHSYCLLTAFCAFVIVQTGGGVNCPPLPLTPTRTPAYTPHCSSTVSSDGDDPQQLCDLEYGKVLLREATNVRKRLEIFEVPARQSILIAFFLYGSNIGLGNQRHAYYFLREASTLYTSGIMDAEPEEDAEHPSVAGKLFWLLLVSERAHAIRRHRPVTLQITPESPPLLEELSGSNSSLQPSTAAFRCLVNLYRPFDETFLGLWNGTHTACSPEFLVGIEEHVLAAVPVDLEIPDIPLADLRVSQQWLRIVIWQLSTTLGFLSSTSTQKCLGFRYPLQIARDLAFATWKLPLESMAAHGVGLIEKLFEVTCTLADVISFLPASETGSSGFELGPEDYLKHFFSLISTLRGGRKRFLPLLLTKVAQTLPGMVQPIVMHLRLNPQYMGADTGSTPGSLVHDASQMPPPSARDSGSASQEPTNIPTAARNQPALPTTDPSEWTLDDFNYLELSRIGDKTPEISKAFLRYSAD